MHGGATAGRGRGPVRSRLLEEEKRSLQNQLEALSARLTEGEANKGAVQQLKRTLEAELESLREQLAEANKARAVAEREKKVPRATGFRLGVAG